MQIRVLTASASRAIKRNPLVSLSVAGVAQRERNNPSSKLNSTTHGLALRCSQLFITLLASFPGSQLLMDGRDGPFDPFNKSFEYQFAEAALAPAALIDFERSAMAREAASASMRSKL